MAAIPTEPSILFRDQRFVVLDKPAGLAVHPGPRGGMSVESWFPVLSRRKDGPWLAHRLDADTAGCLVVALRKAALIAAQAAFAEGRAGKTYWAVVSGGPSDDSGTVDMPLARRDSRDGWRMVVDPSGQRAVTDWRVLGRGDGLAWLEMHPHTGRTHQIRVHCAVLGCPILGDPVYDPSPNVILGPDLRTAASAGRAVGGPRAKPEDDGMKLRLHLLSRSIRLPLVPPLAAVAEPPPHMRAALTACGWAIGAVTQNDRKNS